MRPARTPVSGHPRPPRGLLGAPPEAALDTPAALRPDQRRLDNRE